MCGFEYLCEYLCGFEYLQTTVCGFEYLCEYVCEYLQTTVCGFEYLSPGDFKEVAQLKGDLVLLTVACSQPEYASRSHKFVVFLFSPSPLQCTKVHG